MTEKLGVIPKASGFPDFHLDGDIYQLDWDDVEVPDPMNNSGLPSLNSALYLFDMTRFHLGQIYRIFEADSLRTQIHDFYHFRGLVITVTSRIWMARFLLVLAFGSAFLSRKKCRNPPGSRFFVRSMQLIPRHMKMGKDSFMVIEALALASLYLYAVDHREEAHINVSLRNGDLDFFFFFFANRFEKLGQAMRIAQLDGLHTQLPEEHLGAQKVARCQDLWWSLYILDRQISFSLGLPMTTQDAEITTSIKAPENFPQGPIFSLQVKLSQMQTFILGGTC